MTIGNDLVFLPNFIQSLNETFISRVYTPAELAYITQFDAPNLRYASTWAGKEAVYKALKQCYPTLQFGWRAIEIIRDKPQGIPKVVIHKPVVCHISLTIAHDGDYVWAIALIEKLS
jgi:holo-[acyl-carrier protein] synthase